MHLLLKLFWFWIQGSSLASGFITCYPNESIYYAVAEKSFTFYCDFQLQKNINQHNITDNVSWKKNGDTFSSDAKLEFLSYNKQRLKIDFQNLSESDSGIYKCIYDGYGKLDASNPIELVVLPRPSNPTCTPSKSNFYLGDIASLICETYSYPSLNLFWKTESLPNAVIFNTTNKNKTSSILKFTATTIPMDAQTCMMSTEEGEIRFCTSAVVIKKRTEVRIEGPLRFTLNQPATLSCKYLKSVGERSPSNKLNSENGTLYKSVTSMPNESRQSDFEWRSTNEELFKGILEQANGSSNLNIEKVSDKMHRENITCTVMLDDAMGTDTITIRVDGHMVTHEDGTRPLSSADKSSIEPIGGSPQNFFNFINTPIRILISIIILVVLLCLVILTSLQCLRYFKRPANHNLQVGTMQAIINYGNDGSTHAIPLAILAPTASITSLRAHPSELSLTFNRQTDNRVSERQTLTRSSRPRFADALPSPPSSIEVLASHLSTVESAEPIIEEVREIFPDPLYDEINEKSLKVYVSTSHQKEKLTEAYNCVLAGTNAHNENTLNREFYSYIPDDKPEYKKTSKQASDDEKSEIEQYNDVNAKDRKCVEVNSVVLGTSIGERRKTLDLSDEDTSAVEQCNVHDTADSKILANFEYSYALPIPKLLRKQQEDIECLSIDPLKQPIENQTDSSKESNLSYAKVVPKSQRKQKSCTSPAL